LVHVIKLLKHILKKKYLTFNECNINELIQHGVNALKETVRTKDIKLTVDNTSVMIVGKDLPLKLLTEKELENYIAKVENDENERKENGDDNNNVGNNVDHSETTTGNGTN